MKSFIKLNNELWTYRKMIISMGLTAFKVEYVGAAFGGIWGIIKPFVMVVIYSLVFSGTLNDGTPYYVWIIPGLFLWTYIADSLIDGTAAIRNNSHLVQKVVFPVSILPAIRIFKNLLNHGIFMAIALVILVISGVSIQFYTLQAFYYLFACTVLTIGLTRLFSAMAVMSVDIIHFISTFMQLLFWATPVVWGVDQPREFLMRFLPLLKLNPYYYVVQGYRDSFFVEGWFVQPLESTLYFWGITICIYIIGSIYFEKNRKEFADVL